MTIATSRARAFIALTALALVASGCGDETDPREAAPRAADGGGWTRGADAPLSPRYGSLLAWTGEEVVVLGGHTGAPCPPNARCATPDDMTPDGAAYDPGTDEWRPTADAPIDVDRWTGHVVVDGRLVLGDERGWWSYDRASDSWTALPEPAVPVGGPDAVVGATVYARDRNGDVVALDVERGSWSTLPEDPLRPTLRDTHLFATEEGIVLAGVSYGESAPDEPTLTQIDVWDGESWQRLPRTGMIGWLSHWTGARLIGVEPGGADGGETNNWGRWYPYAGAVDLDTGEWQPLAGVPGYADLHDKSWRADAAFGPLVAAHGYVYDDRTRRWTDLGAPSSELDYELTATWADERLVFVGGWDTEGETLANETWIWAP